MTEPVKPRSIWCGVTQSGDIQAMHFHREGIESLESVSTCNGGSITETVKLLPVLYEPAVPRCATCEHYQFVAADTDEESGMTCESGAMVILDLPQNGTGYCHNHSSLK